jgi:hypothetical protein
MSWLERHWPYMCGSDLLFFFLPPLNTEAYIFFWTIALCTTVVLDSVAAPIRFEEGFNGLEDRYAQLGTSFGLSMF